MEKDKSILEIKKVKHPIFFGISIIIHLENFVYHKRIFSKQCQNGSFKI